MKNYIRLLLFSFVLSGCNADTGLEPEIPYYDIDSYTYPVVPGTEEWLNFRTKEEAIAACQIPTEITQRMTTKALIQAIIAYPFIVDIMNGQYQFAFHNTFSDNNAFNELIRRNDRGNLLLERLKDMAQLTSELGTTAFPGCELELFVSQCLVNDVEILKSIVTTALLRDDLRQKYYERYSTTYHERDYTYILMGKAMLAASYRPFVQAVNRNPELKCYTDGYYPEGWFPTIPDQKMHFLYATGVCNCTSIRHTIYFYSINFIK